MTGFDDPRHLCGAPIFVRVGPGFSQLHYPPASCRMVGFPIGPRTGPLSPPQGSFLPPDPRLGLMLAQRRCQRHLHTILWGT